MIKDVFSDQNLVINGLDPGTYTNKYIWSKSQLKQPTHHIDFVSFYLTRKSRSEGKENSPPFTLGGWLKKTNIGCNLECLVQLVISRFPLPFFYGWSKFCSFTEDL